MPARFGYSWIENSRAARGAKICQYIVFLTKTIVLLSDFKNLLCFFHNEWKHFFRIADRPSDIKSEVQLRYYIVIRSFYYMIYKWKQPSDSESEIRLELSDLFFYMNGNKLILPARFGYSWIENSRAARGATICKYIVFLTKTIVLLSDFKNLLCFFHNEWKHFFRIADRPSDIKSEVQLRYYIVIRSFYYMMYIWKQPPDS